MQQRNSRVDQMRFLAACSVVANHGLYAHQLPLMILAGRWTVPFFFMLSGYFYHQRRAQQPSCGLAQTAKPILTILLVANGVYLLFVGLTTGSLASLATHFTWLVGAYFHLWFLTSLLMGHLVLWLLLRYQLEAILPYLAVLILGTTLGLDAYHQLLGVPAHPLYARSLLSIPFLIIGFLLAKHKLDIHLPKWVAYGLILVGLLLQFLEASWLASYEPDWAGLTFLVGTLLLAVGIILVTLQGAPFRRGLLSAYGRRYSVPLYLYHPMIYYGLSQVLAARLASELWYWLSPVLTMLILVGLLVVVDRQSPGLFNLLSGQWRVTQSAPKRVQEPARV